MTDKVKAKIEAMARKDLVSHHSEDEAYSYRKGATPWAEWCERFEETFWHCEKVCEEIGSYPDDMIELLKEYREWLEEKP